MKKQSSNEGNLSDAELLANARKRLGYTSDLVDYFIEFEHGAGELVYSDQAAYRYADRFERSAHPISQFIKMCLSELYNFLSANKKYTRQLNFQEHITTTDGGKQTFLNALNKMAAQIQEAQKKLGEQQSVSLEFQILTKTIAYMKTCLKQLLEDINKANPKIYEIYVHEENDLFELLSDHSKSNKSNHHPVI
ncbi:MAG: hypothetical protein AB7F64_06685 [Gammaproteobacteria bacterium]